MEIKVASKSNPNSVAGMIANLVKENEERIEMNCIGAGSLNQAIKGLAIARGFLAPSGIDLICIPAFKQVELNGRNMTAIKLIVEVR